MSRKGILSLLLCCTFVVVGRGAEIGSEEFVARRAKLVARLDSSTAVVLRAADPKTRSNDVAYRYRQESNFYYLTGVTNPGAYLMASARGVLVDGVVAHVILFVGKRGADEGVGRVSIPDGVVLATDRFDAVFESLFTGTSTLHVSAPDIGFVNDWLNGKRIFLDRDVRKTLEQSHKGLKIKNVAPLLSALRQIKSAGEVEAIRRAGAMTGDGLKKAMALCRPGVKEYELQAAIEYEMIRQGAAYQGFPSIVGSGENSLILHYEDNRRTTAAGEVVVMDVGAEYEGYSADITRTIPVSGRFTREQRDIYDLVLASQANVFNTIKPGVTFAEVEKAAREVFVARGLDRFIRHGVSHHLGLDVHDVGAMDTLRAGMVITVEPGLYIPKSDTTVAAGYRGWGIRIEDDVLVTESGRDVLTQAVPRRAEDIESSMRKGKK